MANYYTPSNGFSPLSFLYLIVASLLIFPILGFIYSYAIWYIPFPYINFFITAGFGFLVGVITSYLVINLGKVRNPMLAGWAVWVSLAMESPEMISGSLSLASEPGALFNIVSVLKTVGVWGLSDSTVSGTPLLIVWLIEAAIVLVLGVLTPLGKSREPFCEVNNKWFVEKELSAFNFIANPQDSLTALENMDLEYFKTLGKSPNPTTESHSQFVLFSNETNENFLTITNRTKSINDKGEIEFNDQELTRYVEISEALSNLLEGPWEVA